MRTIAKLTATFLLFTRLVVGGEPGDVEILHDPIACWPTDRHLFVDAAFEPATDLQTAKLYLRSSEYPDYYFVEMTLGRDGGGRAIVPMADPGTPEVEYYVELVTRSFSAFRTAEMRVPVSSGGECARRDPETLFYEGPNPDITVGATRAGVPQIPPGFQANGISRFISITGPTPVGGGVSGKTIGIIAGVGGGTAAAFAFAGGSSDATTTAIGGVTTATTSAGSTTTVTGGGSSSTTTTVSGSGPSSTTTTTIGSGPSTTTTVGPSTTTTIGPSTTTTIGPSTTTTIGPSTTTSVGSSTTSVGSSTTSVGSSTTTVASSTTTSAATTSVATTTAAAGANVNVSKGASGAAVRGSSFTYTVTVTNSGPGTATSVLLRDDLPPQVVINFTAGGCSGGASPVFCSWGTMASGASRSATINVFVPTSVAIGTVLTNFAEVSWIDSIARTRSTSHNITVSALTAEPTSAVSLSYRSVLDLRPRGVPVRGSIVLNGQSAQEVGNGTPRALRSAGRRGTNRIEAYVEPTSSEGFWTFDFTGETALVSGSIRVESGEAVSAEGYSVTFAVREGSGPLRFTFELADDEP